MKDIKFQDSIKELKYFTKVDENTWFVQKNKDSVMESFWVTLCPHAIAMTGDYDGVIVQPYCTKDELIGWMAGATTLSYFCEKVRLGNQHHEVKEYTEDMAETVLAYEIAVHFNADDLADYIKEILHTGKYDEKELYNKFNVDCFVVNNKDPKFFENIKKAIDTVLAGSLENRFYFEEVKEDLEHGCKFHDLWEMNPEDYTHQIKWQHECLLWWANNVLKRQDEKEFEVGVEAPVQTAPVM